jgi:hypothetical protein
MDRDQLLQFSTALRALADRYGARSLSVYSFGEAAGHGSVS